MKNFFKIFPIIVALAVTPYAAPKAPSSIAVIVNKHVITQRDIENRINLVLFSTGMENNDANRKAVREQVVTNMIDEKLYIDAAQKIKIEVSKKEIKSALANMAKSNGMSIEKMSELFGSNGIPIKVIKERISSHIGWQKFLSKRYGFLVHITKDEISRGYEAYKAKVNKTRFDLMEIFISARGADANKAKQRADYVCEQLKKGARFDAVARQFSNSQTAKNGGNMGTVYTGDLHPKIEKTLIGMPVGDVCMPIRTHAGYHIYLLRGRSIGGKPDIMKSDIKFVQAVVPATPQMNEYEAGQVMTKVEQFKKCTACSQIKQIAMQNGYQYAESPDAMTFGQFSPQIRGLMLHGGVSEPAINKCLEPAMTPEGLIITMVCSLKHQRERKLTKEDVSINIQNKRLGDYAERDIQRRRQTAYIRCKAGEGYENCR